MADQELPPDPDPTGAAPPPDMPTGDGPDDLPVRVAPPNALRFNRKAVWGVGGALAAVVIASVAMGLHHKPHAQKKVYHAPAATQPRLPSAIVSVPANYPAFDREQAQKRAQAARLAHTHPSGTQPAGNAATPTVKLPARSGGYVAPAYSDSTPKLSPYQRAERQAELKRIKNAQAALVAPVSFNISTGSSQTRTTGSNTTGSNTATTRNPLTGLGSALASLTGHRLSKSDQNQQGEKTRFAKTAGAKSSPYLLSPELKAASPYQVDAGTVIPAVLVTGIDSDLPGHLVGQVSQNVYDTVTGNTLLIPQGTRLIGVYDSRITYGQTRVLVVWQRLIFPNGDSISLKGMPGVDLAGYSGFHDLVDNHWLKIIGGVVLGSVMGATAQMAQGPSYNSLNPSFSQLAAQGIGQSLNQFGQRITAKNLAIQPTLEIRPGYRFNVMVTKDMILRPYPEPAR